jgi:hypothetical protein
MEFKIGEEISYKESYTNDVFIIEDIDADGWIWSSNFYSPTYNNNGKLVRNYHNPSYFKKTDCQLRQDKLDSILE